MLQNITAEDESRQFFVGVIISISMYFRILQNRNNFYDVKFFKIFSGYLYVLMLFNLFINLFNYWRGGGGLEGNSICW